MITLRAPHEVIGAQVISWIANIYGLEPTCIQLSRNRTLSHQGVEMYNRNIVNVNDMIFPQDFLQWQVFDA